MALNLKSIIKSLFFNDEKSIHTKLKRQNVLQVGKNTKLQNLNIEIRHSDRKDPIVTIGDECLISGKLVLETNSSKISIGDNTFIGDCLFVCAEEITIGSDVMFSWGCTVIDTDAHSLNWKDRKNDVAAWKRGVDENNIGKYKDWTKVISKKIVIKNKAWIGFNVIILKGVTVGEGAVVAAGSVVTKDVAPYTLVAGNPANEIKKLNAQ